MESVSGVTRENVAGGMPCSGPERCRAQEAALGSKGSTPPSLVAKGDSGNKDPSIQVFVAVDDQVLPLTVADGSTVAVLQAVVSERTGVPVGEMRLERQGGLGLPLGADEQVTDGSSLRLRGSGLLGGFRGAPRVAPPQGGCERPGSALGDDPAEDFTRHLRQAEGDDVDHVPATDEDVSWQSLGAAAPAGGGWDNELIDDVVEALAAEPIPWGNDTTLEAVPFACDSNPDTWDWQDELMWESQVAETAYDPSSDSTALAEMWSLLESRDQLLEDEASATAAGAPPSAPEVEWVRSPDGGTGNCTVEDAPTEDGPVAAGATGPAPTYQQIARDLPEERRHGGFSVEVEAYPGESVADFRRRVRGALEAAVPGSSENAHLVWGGRSLVNDTATLEEVGIAPSAERRDGIVHCTLGVNDDGMEVDS